MGSSDLIAVMMSPIITNMVASNHNTDIQGVCRY